MKSGQAHALCVPSDVLELIPPRGKYAFPADALGARPVRPSVINRWLGNLWGRTSSKGRAHYEGKPGPPPGTGALYPHFRPSAFPFGLPTPFDQYWLQY
jgi:hypothetical protein